MQIQAVMSASPTAWQLLGFSLVSGAGNLITTYGFGDTATIVPGSVSLVVNSDQTYIDARDGTLSGSSGGTGTINYATGAFTTSAGANNTVTGSFSYFPGNVSEGQRDFINQSESLFPLMLSFDTTNAYQVNQTSTPFFYNVTFYKGSQVPFEWSGQDYQQFFTTNYQGALWATNGKAGFNFLSGTYDNSGGHGGSGSMNIWFVFKNGVADFTTLVIGDKLFFNEWAAGGVTLNGIVGTVSDVTNAASGNYKVTFAANQTVSSTGIVQLLTNSIGSQDGIKWYDGDPTNGSGVPNSTGLGWVNFAPPLTAATVAIDGSSTQKWYLIGAVAIAAFKDRLVFFNPTIGTSSGMVLPLQDTALWSWNGTPYYALPVPSNQTADVRAYYVDQTGLGGYLPAGISAPIVTVSNNEDVLLVGFGGGRGRKARFVYTGNDLQPFLWYSINSELPSDSTFSSITLDKGALDIGTYGISMTDQQSSQRIDLDIPDSVFQISSINNGLQRVNSVRDFFREWVYFNYPINNSQWKYPTQSFLFNYRDNTWAVLYENFTSQGTFRYTTGETWATLLYDNWDQWVDPWNSGTASAQFPNIVGGTPQGYVMIKGEGTGEGPCCTIYAIATANAGTATQITSYNHCLTDANPNTYAGDFIYITGALLNSNITGITQANPCVITTNNNFTVGETVTISSVQGMTQLNGNSYIISAASATSITINVDSTGFSAYTTGGIVNLVGQFNGLIGKVIQVVDANNFVVDIAFPSGTYSGLGVFAKLSQPFMQTKQFNPYWDQGRQVRLSTQKYLMDYTFNAQVTVNVNLSQDPDTVWNTNQNDALVYSQIMYTCPESTNLGLTPANTNLQMPTAQSQYQIWHRFNTSLIGDSVQIGLTLSTQESAPGLRDAQMYNLDYATSEVTLHGINLVVEKGPHLA
jgi:hypothetical protein